MSERLSGEQVDVIEARAANPPEIGYVAVEAGELLALVASLRSERERTAQLQFAIDFWKRTCDQKGEMFHNVWVEREAERENVEALRERSATLEAERNQWKTYHDQQVHLKRELHDRYETERSRSATLTAALREAADEFQAMWYSEFDNGKNEPPEELARWRALLSEPEET